MAETSERFAIARWDVGRRLAFGYGLTAASLLGIVAVRAGGIEPWFWRSVAILLPLVVSLRSALIYAYRRKPAKLSWWLRPTPGAEREFMVTWLIYAWLFGAGALLIAVF